MQKKIAKLKVGERYKGRFGVYFSKDFIPVSKSNLISNKNFHHFHLVLNSQNFDLTADRNNICNKDSVKVKWILENAKKIINEDIVPLAENGYFKLRKEEEIQFLVNSKSENLNKRIIKYKNNEDINIEDIAIKKAPDNESQTVLLLAILLSNPNYRKMVDYIDSILHYANNSTTDLICLDKYGEKVLVEVEFLLSNIFKHEHPISTFDYIVCWKIDMQENSKKTLFDGQEMQLFKNNNKYYLNSSNNTKIYIVEISSMINYIVKHGKNFEILC